ncbi:integrin beta-2-like [Alosa alosa]|nr:integrin beta-2-like [Alosa alosa]
MASHLHLFLGLALLGSQYSFGHECPNAERGTDCATCISLGPDCAWCKYKYFDDNKSLRCGTRMSLREKGCSEKDIVDPESEHTVAEEGEKLNPQRIKLYLRPGKPHTFQVQAKLQRKQKPVDIYFLTSLSVDNSGIRNRAKDLAKKAIEGIYESNEELRINTIGYGLFGNTFVTNEKQRECEESGQVCKPQLYVTHSSTAPHNPYSPYHPWRGEGGLDALMQVVLCRDVIHWGQNDHIVVYATDDNFKLAPETETGNTETINSNICQMNNSLIRTTMRPPSMSELRKVLLENNIQVIFAIKDHLFKEYAELTSKLPKAKIFWVDFSDPSSAPFEQALKTFRTSLVLAHLSVPGLNITYNPLCRAFNSGNLQGICYLNGQEIKKSQTFNVTVSTESCVLPASFDIKSLGSQDNLTVELTARCNCECGDQPDPEFCSYAGNPVCGKCRCDEGHFGASCECSVSDDDSPCRKRQGAPVCSGRGVCVCGQCDCHRELMSANARFYGRYCECDDSNCAFSNGIICGGNGKCICGKCLCDEDYNGEACQCSTKVDRCQSPDGNLCSNHGLCKCNQCVCESVYRGDLCNECSVC